MSLRVSYQPIPALSPSDSAWAWTVSDGQFIVGRFNSKDYADTFKAALIGSGNQDASAERAASTPQERSAKDVNSHSSKALSHDDQGAEEQTNGSVAPI